MSGQVLVSLVARLCVGRSLVSPNHETWLPRLTSTHLLSSYTSPLTSPACVSSFSDKGRVPSETDLFSFFPFLAQRWCIDFGVCSGRARSWKNLYIVLAARVIGRNSISTISIRTMRHGLMLGLRSNGICSRQARGIGTSLRARAHLGRSRRYGARSLLSDAWRVQARACGKASSWLNIEGNKPQSDFKFTEVTRSSPTAHLRA